MANEVARNDICERCSAGLLAAKDRQGRRLSGPVPGPELGLWEYRVADYPGEARRAFCLRCGGGEACLDYDELEAYSSGRGWLK